MSLSAYFNIGNRFLAGNPIFLTVYFDTDYTVLYRITDTDTNTLFYEGQLSTITGKQVVNLSSLFYRSFSVGDGIKNYKVELVYANTVLQTSWFDVYPGAISKRLYRELTKQYSSIFSTKLSPTDQNFLLSTRSFSRLITIPEDELLPIPFYRANKNFSVLGQSFNYTSFGEGVEYLDIADIRYNDFLANNRIEQSFPLIASGNTAVSVLVSGVAKAHTHFIKFRNSLGAQEMIALDDVIDFTPHFESEMVGVYDPITDDVIQVPFSTSYQSKYKGRLRPLDPSEVMFVMDMLLSREQFFVTPKGTFQVRVVADEQVFQTTEGVPLSVSVSIDAIEEEVYYSPLDMEQLGLLFDNIFTEEFTMQYT